MHLRFEDRITMKAVEAYMADETWDVYLNLGDLMDFNCIARFNDALPRRKMGQTLRKDYDYANMFLDRHLAAVRKNNGECRTVFLEGNHDERIERYADKYPEVEGVIEVEPALGLRARGVEWIRYNQKRTFKIGHAHFHHGLYAGKYHANKHAMDFGTCLFYGHTHDVQEYALTRKGDDSTIKAKSLGCLCGYDQAYIKGNPTKWQQALTVFWFYPDGYFQDVTVPIFKHRFVGPTTGKVYDGRKL